MQAVETEADETAEPRVNAESVQEKVDRPDRRILTIHQARTESPLERSPAVRTPIELLLA